MTDGKVTCPSCRVRSIRSRLAHARVMNRTAIRRRDKQRLPVAASQLVDFLKERRVHQILAAAAVIALALEFVHAEVAEHLEQKPEQKTNDKRRENAVVNLHFTGRLAFRCGDNGSRKAVNNDWLVRHQ